MNAGRAAAAGALLWGLTLSGCVGYTIKPEKPASMPRADAPAPLRVGVMMKKPKFEWQGMGMMNTAWMESHRDRWMIKPMWEKADDVGGEFLRALKASGGFAQVDEVKSIGFFGSDNADRDLVIDADFSGKYTQDPAGMGKAMMTGFLLLLPAPFVRYDDAYFAAAELNVYDNTGRLLHKYSERQDVSSSAALFSAGTPGSVSAGIESASANLASRLVTLILADRDGYRRALTAPAKKPLAKPAAAEVAAAPSDASAGSPIAAAAAVPYVASAATPYSASADPSQGVRADSDKAHAELDAMDRKITAAEASPEPAPAPKAAEPETKPEAPLTPDEEKAIDDQVLP